MYLIKMIDITQIWLVLVNPETVVVTKGGMALPEF